MLKNLFLLIYCCNFALANLRRAPLCERHALFASCALVHPEINDKMKNEQ